MANKELLIKQIERKRIELIEAVSDQGINSPIAIKHSQELDYLLNLYNRELIFKLA